jgi:hypothetical protein
MDCEIVHVLRFSCSRAVLNVGYVCCFVNISKTCTTAVRKSNIYIYIKLKKGESNSRKMKVAIYHLVVSLKIKNLCLMRRRGEGGENT